MNFKELPFTQVKVLCFETGSTVVKFKTSFLEENYLSVDVGPTVDTRRKSEVRNFDIPEPKLLDDFFVRSKKERSNIYVKNHAFA